ncbi:lysine exporter LysO family protein [Maribellus sp. YY47]|uniref:lysine exporter LysO family protein n=1 Tax=Maribellus sp. YY47 TaxID=2929486 RepID=UPI002000B803|nr:lysine exporter LysO family protein [Maribellus sp. YY47]MCK3684433.1 lysine exporter LysO family protein [Maribellus sp. YY47]
MINSLIILAFFSIGVLAGVFNLLPGFIVKNDYSMYALYALMFLVGISIGADRNSWKVIKQMNVKILLVPLGVVVGTLGGAALAGLFLSDLNIKESMAVGAGFGYYSLSSIFITQIHGETLGVIALLSNILREIFTLLATPLLVVYFGELAGIASGGATSMDTTMPVIVKYSGKEWGVIAIFSGVVLTIIVPFLVSFILEVL